MSPGAPRARNVHDVAIVGAGMVGAALALTLAQADFDVALLESRAPSPWRAEDDVDLRVVALAPSSRRLLDAVGVWSAVIAARACPYRRMEIWDALAPGTLRFDANDDALPELGHIVENRLLQHVLWQALANDARVRMCCPARVVATEVADDRRVLALDDGTRIGARLVVAADGGESVLRDLVGIGTRARDYSQRAVVAHVTTQRPHEFTAWQRFLPGATIAFLPLGDDLHDAAVPGLQGTQAPAHRPLAAIPGLRGTRAPAHRPLAAIPGLRGTRAPAHRSSIVWSLPEAEATRVLALDDAAFRAELGAAFDFRLGAITSTTARAAFPLRLKLAERYLAPRFALVGDAAHVVHPLAGQGVNLGLRDASELAAALIEARAAHRDFASDAALRVFERRRRSDNALSAHAFDAIQRAFGSSSLPLAALRGAALGVVDRIGPLKRLFARHAAGTS